MQYTEAMLNDDKCFIEDDVWQNVFRSAVFESTALSDSSEIVISLWTIVCPIPSLFKDVQHAVCNSTDTDPHTIGNFYARAQVIRTLLLQWRQQFEEHLLSHTSPEQSRNGKQYDTLGTYMTNLTIINRLSVSLNTCAGSELENEAQDLASQIIELERRASVANPRASLFIAFKAIMAQATLATANEWQQAIRLSIEDHARAKSLISSQVFEHWVNLKGRKITRLSPRLLQLSAPTMPTQSSSWNMSLT